VNQKTKKPTNTSKIKKGANQSLRERSPESKKRTMGYVERRESQIAPSNQDNKKEEEWSKSSPKKEPKNSSGGATAYSPPT